MFGLWLFSRFTPPLKNPIITCTYLLLLMNTMVIVALLVIKHDVGYLQSVCNAVYLYFTLLKHLFIMQRTKYY